MVIRSDSGGDVKDGRESNEAGARRLVGRTHGLLFSEPENGPYHHYPRGKVLVTRKWYVFRRTDSFVKC